MNLDHTILTIFTFTPLVGAVILALLPDKGKIMQWGALLITLLTFVMTLHLPARFIYSTGG
jgi:NADH-quinone oxidoreductase subunit M